MTAGEGGIVLTNDLAHFEHLQSQVNCGRASLTDQYQQKVLGSNYRMTEWQSAMLWGSILLVCAAAAWGLHRVIMTRLK